MVVGEGGAGRGWPGLGWAGTWLRPPVPCTVPVAGAIGVIVIGILPIMITPMEKYDAENAKLDVAAMPFFILLAAI